MKETLCLILIVAILFLEMGSAAAHCKAHGPVAPATGKIINK